MMETFFLKKYIEKKILLLKMKRLSKRLSVKNNHDLYMDNFFVGGEYDNIGCCEKTHTGGRLHANFIFYNERPEAIASQFPRPDQIKEHLEMLLKSQVKSQTVILNKNEFQSLKRLPYFLPHDKKSYGSLTTSSFFRESIDIENIEINVFDMLINDGKSVLEIPVVYCDGWNDKKTITVSSCLFLAEYVRALKPRNSLLPQEKMQKSTPAPADLQDLHAVHCKAGVGRTGTLLATMAMLNPSNADMSLEEILVSLRESRSGEMVQGKRQMETLIEIAYKLRRPLFK